MWSEQSVQDKQPYEEKAAEWKEKHEKVIATYCAKGKSEAGMKGIGRSTGLTKMHEWRVGGGRGEGGRINDCPVMCVVSVFVLRQLFC